MNFVPALTQLIRRAAPLLLVLSVLVSTVASGGSCGVDHDCCDEVAAGAALAGQVRCSDGAEASETQARHVTEGEMPAGSADPGDCSDCPDGCASCHCAFSVLGEVVSHFAPSLANPEFERLVPRAVGLDAPPEGTEASLFRPPRSQA